MGTPEPISEIHWDHRPQSISERDWEITCRAVWNQERMEDLAKEYGFTIEGIRQVVAKTIVRGLTVVRRNPMITRDETGVGSGTLINRGRH
jgi:hypothetical protein